ncbi:MAG TPA: hypothetical protein VMH22_08620 [bacterium]|nr:hypothetical protein [bacterium]
MITATVGLVIGFLVGASKAQDGGIRISVHRHHHRSQAGWDRIAKRIQDGTKLGLDDWRGAGHGADGDWDDLTRRIKERIFGEMREHSD